MSGHRAWAWAVEGRSALQGVLSRASGAGVGAVLGSWRLAEACAPSFPPHARTQQDGNCGCFVTDMFPDTRSAP